MPTSFNQYLRGKKNGAKFSSHTNPGLRSVGVTAPASKNAESEQPPSPKSKVSQSPLPQGKTSFADIMGEATNGDVGHSKKKQPVKTKQPAKNKGTEEEKGVLDIQAHSLQHLQAASDNLKKRMTPGSHQPQPKKQSEPVLILSRNHDNYSQVSWCKHEDFCVHWHPSDPSNHHGTWRVSMKPYFKGPEDYEVHKSCELPNIEAKIATLASRISDKFTRLENEQLTHQDKKNGVQSRSPPPLAKIRREVNEMRIFLNTKTVAAITGDAPRKVPLTLEQKQEQEPAKLRNMTKSNQEFKEKIAAEKAAGKREAENPQGEAASKKAGGSSKSKTASKKRTLGDDEEDFEEPPKAKRTRKAQSSPGLVSESSISSEGSDSESEIGERHRRTTAQQKQAAEKKRLETLARMKEARKKKAEQAEARQKEDEKKKEEAKKSAEQKKADKEQNGDVTSCSKEREIKQEGKKVAPQSTDATDQTTVTKVTTVKKVGNIKYKTFTTLQTNGPSSSEALKIGAAKRKAEAQESNENGKEEANSTVPAPKKRDTRHGLPTPLLTKEKKASASPVPSPTATPRTFVEQTDTPTAPSSRDPGSRPRAPATPAVDPSPLTNAATVSPPKSSTSDNDAGPSSPRKRKAASAADISEHASKDERASRPIRPLKKARMTKTAAVEEKAVAFLDVEIAAVESVTVEAHVDDAPGAAAAQNDEGDAALPSPDVVLNSDDVNALFEDEDEEEDAAPASPDVDLNSDDIDALFEDEEEVVASDSPGADLGADDDVDALFSED